MKLPHSARLAGQRDSGERANPRTNATAAVTTGVATQNPRIRSTIRRLVTEKFWLVPAPSTAYVTVWVVESGKWSPMAPTNSMSEVRLWATNPRNGSTLVSL